MEKKVLIVDDEEDICEVLDITLSDEGYEVFTASSGEEALRLYKKVNPPIILTDIRMPGLDGIELLKRIKGSNPDTEVIMITGHGDMDLAIKSLKLEATDFITKPINYDILKIALKSAVLCRSGATHIVHCNRRLRPQADMRKTRIIRHPAD